MSRSNPRTTTRRRGRKRLPSALWANLLLIACALVVVVAVPAWSTITDAGDADAASTPLPATSAPASPIPTPSAPTPSAPTPDPTASASEPTDDAAQALVVLAELRDVSGTAQAQYDRDAFGSAWYDVDRNGCDTRNDILRRDLTDTTLKSDTNGCKVLTGTLVDPYSAETVDFVSGTNTSSLVQIDHVIPLSWAWHHGAEHWTLEERREFANAPDNLLATIGSVNQSKSDSGPDQWMPPAEAVHCEYVSGYVGLMSEWDLGVNTAERAFFEQTLIGC